nr:hypothetical protein [Roseovarius sp. W115]
MHVYRRLALAHLPEPVLDALAANEISLSNAAAFTVGNDEKVMLEVLEQALVGNYSDHHIKQALKPDSLRNTDQRVIYVTEAGYDEAVRGELVRFLAAQFKEGDEKLTALVAKATKPKTREVWTPTAANFFGRVGGPYMVEIWRDLLELAENHPTVTTFAKLKKGEKAKKLEDLFRQSDLRSALGVTEAQAAKIDAWLPEGME